MCIRDSCQCGAVRKRGTDFATHLVASAVAAASMMSLSIFVLFLDLVKAFDRVVRQLVVGWGNSPTHDRKAYL
eukprot:2184649-Karenia_brevis.AAC.1